MLDLRPSNHDSGYYGSDRSPGQRDGALLNYALSLFNRARRRADLRRLWYWLLQRPNRLLDLGERPLGDLQSRHYTGVQPVLLDQICGSQSRANGFDAHFYPQTDRIRQRWLSVAIARLQRIPLEPIKLIELHDYYFVQDGHHRISVARALSESALDAEIIRWSV